MDRLDRNWLTEGLIDFEYKKYVLLAYLKHIRQNFSANRLYPFLSDLIDHYGNLKNLQKEKTDLSNQFPKQLNLKELWTNKLTYERIIKDDNISKELEDIIIYALGEIQDTMKIGKEIYEIVEGDIKVVPIGLRSLYQNEGFMLIDYSQNKDIKIYRYQITVFEGPSDKYRAIHTTYLGQVRKSISATYEQIRLMLVHKSKDLINPATYLIDSGHTYPLEETLLPVAKRLLVRYVNVA
jgi:hypothetical protein